MKYLKWFARPIIPLVYGESLSYMEMVGKCVEKINELIHYISDTLFSQIQEEIDGLIIDTVYDETNETLTIDITVGDGE